VGGGRVAALEIMIGTPRVRKLILNGETNKVPAAIQASQSEGMQTFNQALVELVRVGTVEEEDALKFSPKPDELRMNLRGIYSGTSGL
jgi:Tfp pilus assembly pilus retraction ATPase PilT